MIKQTQLKRDLIYYDELEKQYKKASKKIEAEINNWYNRFAINNKITLVDAKKRLDSRELDEFKWDVQDYIKYGKQNATNQLWMKELENASARVHITRLESLKLQIQQQIEVLFDNQLDGLDQHLRSIYEDTYYHTAYEIQKGFNIGWSLHEFNSDELSKIIFKPWTVDGKTFRDRIWTNKQDLINTLHIELTQGIIRGDSPRKAIKAITNLIGAEDKKRATYKAGRLVMTESAFFSSASQQKCFNDLYVEKFEIVATLDLHTSEICQDLDGEIFNMKDYEIGVTAPPFHVWCRSTTVPYFEDNYTERAAKGVDGKTYYVDGNMTYGEWHKEYVEGNPEAVLAERKLVNLSVDKKQYENYQDKIGAKYLPKSFAEFQNIKYTNESEYGILKAQNKGMNYFNSATNNEPEITKVVKDIANTIDVDTLGLEYKIKSKESYLRKIRANYNPNGNEYEINDILRYTYGTTTDKLADKTIKSIDMYSELGYNTVKVKNSWLDNTNPYNGINTIVQAPNGQKFELQYHTKESFALKNGELHKLYEKQRVIENKESEEYIDLRNKMFELSDKLTIPNNVERVK